MPCLLKHTTYSADYLLVIGKVCLTAFAAIDAICIKVYVVCQTHVCSYSVCSNKLQPIISSLGLCSSKNAVKVLTMLLTMLALVDRLGEGTIRCVCCMPQFGLQDLSLIEM